ncbi:MAG: hypothetical protein RLO81_19765 [Fulvivirga sp.]|uniref:hypothetical protein n=1 Tax=Fulvivirga sp. TaxID=1931237 RepID=UPI0032F00BA7
MKTFHTILILLITSMPLFSQEVDSITVANTVADSLKVNQLPIDDSTQLTTQAQETLSSELETNIPTDSTELANKAEKGAVEQLNKEGIEVNGIPTDSSQVADKAKSVAKEQLNKQGIQVAGIPTDSAAVKNEAKSLAKKEFANQTGFDAPDITIDSTTTEQVKKEAVKRGEAALKNTDEFKALGAEGNGLEGLAMPEEAAPLSEEQLGQMQAKKEMKQKMAAHAKDFISEHSEQIGQVQEQMSDLKKVYSEVPNSNDLTTAKKRSSLEGEPLKKRLTFGGNFNVNGTDPLTIDFSPTLGYKLNKLFEVGITGSYRAKMGSDNVNSVEDEQVYGYSVYANHKVFKNFFGYLEGEHMSKVVGSIEEGTKREWYPSLLAGIGRSFKISKSVEIQTILTYNFLHKNTEGVYENPVVFKTGVRVNR